MTLTKNTEFAEVTDPMLPRPFRVTSKRAETHDTITLDFEAADGGPPIGFSPGTVHDGLCSRCWGGPVVDFWRP